jgi:hypothetical protein
MDAIGVCGDQCSIFDRKLCITTAIATSSPAFRICSCARRGGELLHGGILVTVCTCFTRPGSRPYPDFLKISQDFLVPIEGALTVNAGLLDCYAASWVAIESIGQQVTITAGTCQGRAGNTWLSPLCAIATIIIECLKSLFFQTGSTDKCIHQAPLIQAWGECWARIRNELMRLDRALIRRYPAAKRYQTFYPIVHQTALEEYRYAC